jgi:hypothetical protein
MSLADHSCRHSRLETACEEAHAHEESGGLDSTYICSLAAQTPKIVGRLQGIKVQDKPYRRLNHGPLVGLLICPCPLPPCSSYLSCARSLLRLRFVV